MTHAEPLERLLASTPLPPADGDKKQRGTLVLVAGAASCPGAAILAATAAMRAGVGRVQIVTAPEVISAVGTAVPEALVVPWDLCGAVPDSVAELLGGCNGACVGPGLPPGADDTARAIVEHLPDDVPLLVDALALPAAADLRRQGQRCALAPNAYEAARLLGDDEASVADADLAELAHRLATDLTTAVTVRGGTNVVADGAQTWCQPVPRGLGIAGSGDVFAGITSGLLARRLPELTGLGWGVAVHAEAGRGLAGRRTNPGYLARDLLDRIPDAIQHLTERR